MSHRVSITRRTSYTHARLRHEVAQLLLVGERPPLGRTLEVRQVPLGDRHGLGFVLDRDIDDAVRDLHVDRTDGRGLVDPESPPSIIAGPPMPMFEFAVAMITSQQPRIAALPAKQNPLLIPTSGTSPLSAAKSKARQSRYATPDASVSPGSSAPPSVKNTIGSRKRSARSKRRSFLWWFQTPWVPARTV